MKKNKDREILIQESLKNTNDYVQDYEGKKAMKEAAEMGTPLADLLRKASECRSEFSSSQWRELNEWFEKKMEKKS